MHIVCKKFSQTEILKYNLYIALSNNISPPMINPLHNDKSTYACPKEDTNKHTKRTILYTLTFPGDAEGFCLLSNLISRL